MGEYLKQAYEKSKEITSSNEYKYLAKMFTDLYAEKECLKSKVRQLIAENTDLYNKLQELRKEMKNGTRN